MLTLAIVLLVLWLLGIITGFVFEGLIHILLVVGLIVLIYRLATGRRVL
jgi:hypothetical protein